MEIKNIYRDRKKKLRKLIKELSLDIILLYSSKHDNRYTRWIAGIDTRNVQYYFITSNSSGFIDISYVAEMTRRVTTEQVIECEEENTMSDFLISFLASHRKIGIAGNAPFHNFIDIDKNIKNITEYINNFIIQKSTHEIKIIEENGHILIEALEEAKKQNLISSGKSEIEFANFIKRFLIERGDDFSFPVSITSGEKLKESTLGKPSDRVFEESDIIAIDFGLFRNGFHSDCTRMFFLKNEEAEENYKKLCEVQSIVIEKITNETLFSQIVAWYQEELWERNIHPEKLEIQDLGHGVGFAPHESPFFYNDYCEELEIIEGMVVTLEPEIVFPKYRLRTEDMIAIVDGKAKVLTK